MQLLQLLPPYLITTFGIIADSVTTRLGLTTGLIESHPLYNPIYAFAIFFTIVTVATLSFSKEKQWLIYTIAAAPYIAALNNILLVTTTIAHV